jgi:hypothetical protein
MKPRETVFLNKEFQNDNVYGDVIAVPTSDYFGGMPVAKKMSQTIISNGTVVHTGSPTYGLLPNKDFFGRMEHELIEQNINYKQRSFNLEESRFYVDYILDDESKIITINGNTQAGVDDTIVPMIRLTNSYDGTLKKAGYLGFFRKVCHNGMHMTHTQIEFSIKATKGNMQSFVPKIDDIVKRFLDNEMYSIKDKIDKMKVCFIDEKKIFDWIKDLNEQDKVFRFDKSDKNDAPSLNSELVHDIVIRDAIATGTEPNAWLVYSAFNELIHGKLQKNFTDQKALDTKVFNTINQMVGAL